MIGAHTKTLDVTQANGVPAKRLLGARKTVVGDLVKYLVYGGRRKSFGLRVSAGT